MASLTRVQTGLRIRRPLASVMCSAGIATCIGLRAGLFTLGSSEGSSFKGGAIGGAIGGAKSLIIRYMLVWFGRRITSTYPWETSHASHRFTDRTDARIRFAISRDIHDWPALHRPSLPLWISLWINRKR